jgi:tRNA-dihydrouridine synthase B
MVTIGNQKFTTNIFLAPLAGCADLSFRLIARECGAQFCFFEMCDANSILYKNAETMSMLKTTPDDTPIGAQLLGTEPDTMLAAAEKLLEQRTVRLIDINSACPVKKVIKKGCGAYLLKEPLRLAKIIRRLTHSLDLPITVKLRTGFSVADTAHITRLAQMCEDAGAAALFVHGRTREQAYRGEIDYASIRAIKNSVSIPVFGSGNVLSVDTAEKMFSETGCNGVLVARGAFGNPWLIGQIEKYKHTGMRPKPLSLDERVKTLKRHLAYVETYSDARGSGKIGFMRKIAQWYVYSFPGARALRNSITFITDYPDLLACIDSIEV